MTKKNKIDGKYTCFTFPNEIIEYFDKQAKEELIDEGTEVNVINMGRMRNNLIISALEAAITIYEGLGVPNEELE